VKTDGLITSELILLGDYRTLGLSNPRIVEPSDYRYITGATLLPPLFLSPPPSLLSFPPTLSSHPSHL